MRAWHALVTSLILHALIVASLFPFKQTIKPSEVLEFELKPVAQLGATASQNRKSNDTPTSKTARNNPRSSDQTTPKSLAQERLQKLLDRPYNSAHPTDAANDEGEGNATAEVTTNRGRSGAWDEGGYTTKDDPTVAWGAGSGTFERIQDSVLMNRFHNKVDALLFYPGVLARRKMTGTVNSRVVINAAGDCDWKRTKIASANPYFRVYILQMLKKVCSENFKKYTKGREMTNIDMSFAFVIDEDMTTKELIERNQQVVGNVLLFYRHNRLSVAEWHLGPFTGMFPIPFVQLDFEWIFENFDTYFNNIDPLGDYHSKTDDFIESY